MTICTDSKLQYIQYGCLDMTGLISTTQQAHRTWGKVVKFSLLAGHHCNKLCRNRRK